MQIRFARADDSDWKMADPAEDHACDWCGFRCSDGILDYQDEGGSRKRAFRICFNARHVLTAPPYLFQVIWLPELPQPDLAHLSRVIALVTSRFGDEKDKTKLGRAITGSKSLFGLLFRRDKALNATLKDLGLPSPLQWTSLDQELQSVLLPGLRLLPIGFSGGEIQDWHEGSSSLSGYTLEMLVEKEWFRTDLLALSETGASTGAMPNKSRSKPVAAPSPPEAEPTSENYVAAFLEEQLGISREPIPADEKEDVQ